MDLAGNRQGGASETFKHLCEAQVGKQMHRGRPFVWLHVQSNNVAQNEDSRHGTIGSETSEL